MFNHYRVYFLNIHIKIIFYMKDLHYGKFPSMTSYPFCDVVVSSDDALPPNGNTAAH